ncbi:hypothetical protein [Candidatus Uabimicrobium sp. HlEnr_7]|uniref:hypothetical protein n=1 Tax=Candidatus Uabimicrobium helgolandensis TaxID=3095367 RepID=UPI0035561383
MRYLAAFWGAFGVFTLLATALYRLTPIAWDIFDHSLHWYHYLVLVINVIFMAHSEGYRGFQKSFSPRVTARVHYLSKHASWELFLFAPFFCMGYFHASRKTKIITISLTSFIVVLIILLKYVPQPWRGIIDWGVVVGLSWGVISLIVFIVQTFATGKCVHDGDIPTL